MEEKKKVVFKDQISLCFLTLAGRERWAAAVTVYLQLNSREETRQRWEIRLCWRGRHQAHFKKQQRRWRQVPPPVPLSTSVAAAANKRYCLLDAQLRCGTTQICWLLGEQFNNLPLLVPSHPCFRRQSRRAVQGFRLTGGIPIDSSIGKAVCVTCTSPPLGKHAKIHAQALLEYIASLVLRLPLFL